MTHFIFYIKENEQEDNLMCPDKPLPAVPNIEEEKRDSD